MLTAAGRAWRWQPRRLRALDVALVIATGPGKQATQPDPHSTYTSRSWC